MTFRSLFLNFFVVTIVFAFSACSRVAETGGDMTTDSVTVNGVTITYPLSFDRDDLKVTADSVILDFASHQLTIIDGELKFDDVSFGAVPEGAEIEVRSDGSIGVNSKTVTPR